jgi:hypothetical protein
MKPTKNGNAFAGVLLILFIVLFVVFLAYIASPAEAPPKEQKTYFENLSFALETGKTWRVGVPIAFDGTLHLSFASNDSIRVFAKNQNRYLIDSVTGGHKDYFIHVTVSMGVVEVALTNAHSKTVEITELTCVLAT